MPSSLFGPQNGSQPVPRQHQSSLRDRVQAFVDTMGGNPDTAMQLLMRSNPKFAEFVTDNMGLSPQQILRKYGK